MHDEDLVEPTAPENADAAEVIEPTQPADEKEATPEESAGPRLIVKRSGAETDTVFAINPGSIIGRFDPAVGPIDVDLASLPEGVYVSRKHARLDCVDGVWSIKDMGSSNGTFVLRDDFERVEEAELADGTEFALGNARFVFRIA